MFTTLIDVHAIDCEIKRPSLGKSVKRLNACAYLRMSATSVTIRESLY